MLIHACLKESLRFGSPFTFTSDSKTLSTAFVLLSPQYYASLRPRHNAPIKPEEENLDFEIPSQIVPRICVIYEPLYPTAVWWRGPRKDITFPPRLARYYAVGT